MGTELNGATALVTGSTKGIGKAIAVALAASGVHVIISGRDAAAGSEIVTQLRESGGKVDFVRSELGTAATARELAEDALAVTGRIDILVNSAGIYSFGPTAEVAEAAYDEMYNLNVKVPFFLVGELAPRMAESAVTLIATGREVLLSARRFPPSIVRTEPVVPSDCGLVT